MFAWNDYASHTTESLIALHREVADRRARGVECDNFAPGTCCDDCNFRMIVAELTERLSAPVTA